MIRSRRALRVLMMCAGIVVLFVLSAATVSAGSTSGMDVSDVARFQEQGRILGDDDFRDHLWLAFASFLLVVVVDAVVIARILQNRRR